jgi:hypothetical protein
MGHDLVLIEWVDSGQPIPGWQWLSDLDPRRAHKCVSVGFLIQNDEQIKVLAPNLGSSNGDENWDQASGLITIPTVAITKLERLTSASGQASKMADDRVAA